MGRGGVKSTDLGSSAERRGGFRTPPAADLGSTLYAASPLTEGENKIQHIMFDSALSTPLSGFNF